MPIAMGGASAFIWRDFASNYKRVWENHEWIGRTTCGGVKGANAPGAGLGVQQWQCQLPPPLRKRPFWEEAMHGCLLHCPWHSWQVLPVFGGATPRKVGSICQPRCSRKRPHADGTGCALPLSGPASGKRSHMVKTSCVWPFPGWSRTAAEWGRGGWSRSASSSPPSASFSRAVGCLLLLKKRGMHCTAKSGALPLWVEERGTARNGTKHSRSCIMLLWAASSFPPFFRGKQGVSP